MVGREAVGGCADLQESFAVGQASSCLPHTPSLPQCVGSSGDTWAGGFRMHFEEEMPPSTGNCLLPNTTTSSQSVEMLASSPAALD